MAETVSQAGWVENFLQVALDSQNYYLISAGATSILFRSMVGGVNDQSVLTYDPNLYRHWRVRHDQSSNAVSFETSADGDAWTTRKTATAAFSLTAVKFYLMAGAWGTGNGNPGAAKYDNFQFIASSTPLPPPSCTPPTSLIISEFRFRGSGGPADEFIEFYNNSDSAITVCTADQSSGWALAARSADGTSASTLFVIPAGTIIPGRGHFLAVNDSPDGYSLKDYAAGAGSNATGDLIYTGGIEDNSGIALFKTSNSSNFTTANRLDAVGFTGSSGAIPDLYREGSGLNPIGSINGEYTFVRNIPNGSGGVPSDTNNNSSDFLFLSTNGGVFGGTASKLGAPGPENLFSPIVRSVMPLLFVDDTVTGSVPPNRVRDLTSDPANNSTYGTLSIRRRVVNNTGTSVTRLRFRITGITTFPVPSGTADMRARTSTAVTISNVNDANTCATLGTPSYPPCSVTVQGTTLERPPGQPSGGGYNSTLMVTLPQPLAAGASLNVQWLLGLQQTGSFQFFIIVEALP